MDNLSVYLARFSRKRGLAVWGIIIVLCLFSLLSIIQRGFNTNLLNLIPHNAQKTQSYLKLIRDFGIIDETYIILDGDIIKNIIPIERFVDEIRQSNLIRDVRYRLDPSLIEFVSQLSRKNAFLFLSDDELEKSLTVLQPENMEKRLRKVRNRLILPSKPLALSDPLGFAESILARMPSLEMPFDRSSGLFISEKGKRLFIVIEPAGESRDIRFDHKLIEFINGTYKKHFQSSHSLEIGITGSHPITYYEQKSMKSDMQRTIVTAFLGVTVVFIIFLRTIRGMFLAFLPICVSVILTMGLAVNLFGAMSEVSGAFGAMIVGLGVDLAIVLYVRHLYTTNIEHTVKETSGAIWTGVLTTAATFYPMIYSDFRGIKELGFLTGTGIILCAVFIFLLSSPFTARRQMGQARHTGFESLPLFALRYRRLFLFFTAVLLLGSLYGLKELTFTADLQQLGSEDNRARKLFHSMNIKRGNIFISGTSPTIEKLVKDSAGITRKLADQDIHNVLSIASFIPDREQQLRNIERLRSVNTQKLVEDFTSMAQKYGFSESNIHRMVENIVGFFHIEKPISLNDVNTAGMDKFLKRFHKKEGNAFRFIIIVNETKDITGLISDYDVTGPAMVRKELSSMLKKNAGVITIVGIILVNIILLIKFRNVLHTLYAQIPVTLAIVLTGAIMKWLGMEIHIMNAVVAVMLFGIGTDYSIHLLHHIIRKRDLNTIIKSTGRAISIAAYTTIIGFGSIYFSSYKGLSDMGFAVTIGCLFTLFFSLTLVPIFMNKWFEGTR